jgi:hypothetical protein
MARTALAPTQIAITGVAPALVAANVDGHSLPNTGREYVQVHNGSGAPITVTVPTPVTVNGRAVADDPITVPAGADRLIGPFDINVHNQRLGVKGSDVHIDFSSVTTVTVGAYRLPVADG